MLMSRSATDCYKSKVSDNRLYDVRFSSTGRVLSKQGHRRSSSRSSASATDCYQSKIIRNSRTILTAVCIIGRLLSKRDHLVQELLHQPHRPIAIRARLLTTAGLSEIWQGRLHHRPIAIKARSSASASPTDCYQSKVVDNSRIV